MAAADVEVRVDGMRNAAGTLRVAICAEDHFLQPSCALSGAAPAGDGRVRIGDVPAGRFAVEAFHDENANGKLDRTLLGRPAEGMAFSRDAPMRFGPPRYSDAVVDIPADGATLTMTMRYF